MIMKYAYSSKCDAKKDNFYDSFIFVHILTILFCHFCQRGRLKKSKVVNLSHVKTGCFKRSCISEKGKWDVVTQRWTEQTVCN